MFAKHVSRLTSAYCHDELSPAQSRRVAEHLISCQRCRSEFEEVRFGARLAAQLPLIEAPESLWRGIEIALEGDGQRTTDRHRGRTNWFFMQPGFAVAALALIVLVAGFAVFWWRQSPKSEGSTWDVARLDGAPRIGSTQFNDKGKLGVGQWLETDTNSRAQISVGNIGKVDIDPNTRVRLIETNPTEHRLELARGRLSARISAPPKLFFVNTPSGVAEDLGCAYTLEVDEAGRSLLRVTTGWVALQLKDRESVVPAGAACATRPGIGPGTPYFEDASELFRTALAKFDFEPNDTQWSKIPALDIVLHDARPRDAMTLWYLLSRVQGNDRVRVYDRTARLVPPPPGVTREGILRLDRDMLNRWREQMDTHSESLPATIRDLMGRVRSGVYRRAKALH
jgi:FecR protein/Putative zinc-finger